MINDPIQTLKDAGYHVVRDRPVSKRLNSFIQMTLTQQQVYRDPLIVRLLSNAQLRKGNAMTSNQMLQAVESGEFSEHFIEKATSISRTIFQRGYTLECPDCSMADWYPLHDMVMYSSGVPSYHFVCKGFPHPFPLPINAQIEYKLNPLVREAVKDGALTIINALAYLNKDKSFRNRYLLKHIVVEVKSRQLHTDIDILLTGLEDSLLVECKDNFQTTDSAIAELQCTIETGLMLADTLGYQYVFATLQDEVPLAIQQQLDAANARLLTASDLLKPYEG